MSALKRCVTYLPQTVKTSSSGSWAAQNKVADEERPMAKENNGDKPKLKQKQYEKELRHLQVELCHLQEWVKANG